jgi:hypothetical protein
MISGHPQGGVKRMSNLPDLATSLRWVACPILSGHSPAAFCGYPLAMTETDDRATSSATDIVERLAEALGDFVAAASVMADRIEYTIGEQEMSGPEAVIAS